MGGEGKTPTCDHGLSRIATTWKVEVLIFLPAKVGTGRLLMMRDISTARFFFFFREGGTFSFLIPTCSIGK